MIVTRAYIEGLLTPIFGAGKVAYSQFTDEDTVAPPFAAYYFSPTSDNLFADGKVYACFRQLYIESYADDADTDTALQRQIEAALDAAELPWQKETEWIESEHMFLTAYNMEVLTDG